ncbi:hypothetical protein [Caulobacter sp. NIBR2454]|uniref:hypothetical protein n=1 Tax=Caulobacter sp. NIBR2454 TaxID=3015996 RepID=UPI0022B74835|nr:hypothetical protein [Caulobacter sp. NIBR2454]
MTHRNDLIASDFVVPTKSDTDTGNFCGFVVLVAGDVVVTTSAGQQRTITNAPAGLAIQCGFTQFRTASTATILAYIA